MIPRWLLLSLLAYCRCQEIDMRADITFNADNDRYDVGNIIHEQNRVFNDMPSTMDMDYDTRKSGNGDLPLVEVLKQARQQYQRSRNDKTRRMTFSYRPSEYDDFDYSNRMDIADNHDELQNYNKNLESFRRQKPRANEVSLRRNYKNIISKLQNAEYNTIPSKPDLQHAVLKYLHGGTAMKRGLRRMSGENPENEILNHYAVPLRMKVRGYLEVPKE